MQSFPKSPKRFTTKLLCIYLGLIPFGLMLIVSIYLLRSINKDKSFNYNTEQPISFFSDINDKTLYGNNQLDIKSSKFLNSLSNLSFNISNKLKFKKSQLLYQKSLNTLKWLLQQQQDLLFDPSQRSLLNQYLSSLPPSSAKNISTFDAFDRWSGVNVWDLYPPQVSCPDLTRVGKIGDGGKWLCGASWLTLQKERFIENKEDIFDKKNINENTKHQDITSCIVYSFGISLDSSFEYAMLDLAGCEVHAFDPTVGGLAPRPKYNGMSSSPIATVASSLSANTKIFPDDSKRVRFHKVALGVQTGPTNTFSLTENLFDIMKRLNHTYIDVIKIDIEGKEWEVFPNLFNSLMNQQKQQRKINKSYMPIFPVGQVLIELHYQDMVKVNKFFNLMFKFGFLSFSREINLISTMAGGKPLACEYSFINPELFFGGGHLIKSPSKIESIILGLDHRSIPTLRGSNNIKDISDKKNISPWYKDDKVDHIKAVIYFLTQKVRVIWMKRALILLYNNFWRDYHYYPVVIFHDDLLLEDMKYLQDSVPLMKLYFEEIHFKLPTNSIYNSIPIPSRTTCAPKSSTIGYRHMIFFHSTMIHKELLKSGSKFKDVEYVLRLDDDSHMTNEIGYDIFFFMKINSKKYGFVSTIDDDETCIDGLWDFSRDFLQSQSKPVINISNTFFNEIPDGLVIYNNFEVSHISLWKDMMWDKYMNAINECGGIYLKRWGDAPIHTIAISFLLTIKQVHAFTDIGYRHDPFVAQRPRGLPPPNANPLKPDITSTCYFFDHWVCNGTMTLNNNSFMNFNGDELDSPWSNSDEYSQLHIGNQLVVSHDQNSLESFISAYPIRTTKATLTKPSESQFRTVLFSFGHHGRELVLAKSIISFYNGYAKRSKTPFIIFHPNGEFDSGKVIEQVGGKISSMLTFEAVSMEDILANMNKKISNAHSIRNFTSYLSTKSFEEKRKQCISPNLEIIGASDFLRYDAPKRLTMLGYEWHFRFSDDSKLNKDISYNPISLLSQEGKKYGFLNVVKDRSLCVGSLWNLANELCDHPLMQTDWSRCSDLIKIWPKDVVVYTNFEISHHSVFSLRHSRQCKALKKAIDNHTDTAYWGDAAIHTICVILSLSPSEIKKLEYIEYETILKTSAKTYNKDYINDSKDTVSIEKINEIKDKVSLYESISIKNLDSYFLPQRFGWLGGDVCASIALPNQLNFKDIPLKYIWIFGDSMIGISSSDKRLQAQIISNSIAVSTLDNNNFNKLISLIKNKSLLERSQILLDKGINNTIINNIKSIKYYWGNEKNGSPAPILKSEPNLQIKDRKKMNIDNDKTIFWPNGGLSVSNIGDNDIDGVRLLIIGQDVISTISTSKAYDPILGESNNALSFKELSSSIFIVLNPYEPPDLWEHQNIVFPDSKHGRFRWIALVESNGKDFLTNQEDYIYIIGTYEQDINSELNPQYDLFSTNSKESYQVISRIKGKDILMNSLNKLELLTYSYNNSNNSNKVWIELYNTNHDKIQPWKLFSNPISELSINYNKQSSLWIITCLRMSGNKIQQCVSSSIDGPYLCSYVAKIEAPWDSKELITYAAKAHPEIKIFNTAITDSDDKSYSHNHIISFVSNAVKGPVMLFKEEFRNAYTPKFILLKAVNVENN